MSKIGKDIEQLELKYCERCGGLWLRGKGSELVFCPSCAPKMAELPQLRGSGKSRPRMPKGAPEFEIEGSVIELCAVTAEVEL
jgi:hypothetical protein